MKASSALRPGLILGEYPEREEPQYSNLETFASRLGGAVLQFTPDSKRHYSEVPGKVAAFDHEIRTATDQYLHEQLADIRTGFANKPLDDDLSIRSFGLIREISSRILDMRHFDSQLIGGWVLLQGRVAEMQTGEGKTLTATLAAATAAFAGIPVHVVTVNDYLVTRDATEMGPLYSALGLTVGTIVEGMEPDEKRAAYRCDITYCSNKQLVFDYLADRLSQGERQGRIKTQLSELKTTASSEPLLMRGLCYAIVDETDSVLIDEARTPLIISRASDMTGRAEFYAQALHCADQLNPAEDYDLSLRDRHIELTERGKQTLRSFCEELGGSWSGERRRNQIVKQALIAKFLFIRDQHYLVKDGAIQIIDEYTGRAMEDRTWEQELHQLIETKEQLEITAQPETLARISFQRFFRRYLHLSGMTGTAKEVKSELWSVYRLKVMVVPTNRPMRRRKTRDQLLATLDDKWDYVVIRAREYHEKGQPVLIGTRSVGASEALSERLKMAGLPFELLNARQDRNEAEIIAEAGLGGRITVATNMAGRGTDIKLGTGVAEQGGLHVILTEKHDARRIDRQLLGRCARQGDPGTTEAVMSMEDELVAQMFSQTVVRWVKLVSLRPGLHWFPLTVMSLAQRLAERQHERGRRDLLAHDGKLENTLAFSGRGQ